MALSLVFGAVSCADEEDEKGVLNISGNTCSVNFTNESTEEYARAFSMNKLDRDAATIKVTYDMAASKANTKGQIGVMGFIFDEQKVKITDAMVAEWKEDAETDKEKALIDALKGKEYYDFTIAGFSPNSSGQRYYVSRFEGVDPKTLQTGNTFLDLLGKDAEWGIDPLTKADGTTPLGILSEISKVDNKYVVWMKWNVEDNGHMTIKYYKDSDFENNVLKNGSNAFKTVDVASTSLLDKEEERAEAAKEEPKTVGLKDDVAIGYYANVYGAATLVATMEQFDLHGNAIAIEE